MTAMVWGFALPIAHLACGMTADPDAVLCDDHAATDGAAVVAGEHASHEAPRLHVHQAHEAPAPRPHHAQAAASHGPHHAHAAAANPMHADPAEMQTVRHDAPARTADVTCPVAEFESRDHSIECCWVDATAIDRRAPLPSLTQMPDVSISFADTAPLVDVPVVRAIHWMADTGSTPPIARRLLFSVFLI